MVTTLCSLLRKIRFDNGEVLYDMAKKLNISSSELSSIELGKKTPKSGFIAKISRIYNLNMSQEIELHKALTALYNPALLSEVVRVNPVGNVKKFDKSDWLKIINKEDNNAENNNGKIQKYCTD